MFTYSIFTFSEPGNACLRLKLGLNLFVLLWAVGLLAGCKDSSSTTALDPIGPGGVSASQQAAFNRLVNDPNPLVFLPGTYAATHIKWTGDLGNNDRIEGSTAPLGDDSIKGTYVPLVETVGDSLQLSIKGEGNGPSFLVATPLGRFASKGLITSWNSSLGPPVRYSTFKLTDKYTDESNERVRVQRLSAAQQTNYVMSFVLAQERNHVTSKKGRYLIQHKEAQFGLPADLNDTGIFGWMEFSRVTPGIVRW